MGGIALFTIYLFCGFLLSHFLFTDKRILVRIWLGIVFGIVGLMWSHVPFSFMFDFTILSHIAGFLVFAGLITAVYFIRRKNENNLNPFTKVGKNKNSNNYLTDSDKLMLKFLLGFSIIGIVLLSNHTLVEYNGGYYTGQATYGDMNFHLGIITSIAEQKTFPPDYNIFPGAQLDYYFFSNSISSSLLLFGTNLKAAYMLPMIVGFITLFAGFWFLADEILEDKKKSALAFVFYFLNGGLGTFYLLSDGRFKEIFTEWYRTPTNYRWDAPENLVTTINWTNTIVDMMLPQRATLFGWMTICAVFYLLYCGVFKNKKNHFLPAGILAGLIPMIQTYSYFAIGLVALCWLIYSFIRALKPAKKNKIKKYTTKDFIFNWLKFGLPAVFLAVPQFLIWIFGAVGGESFIRPEFNGLNEAGDFWLWYWIKNVGIVFVLLIPAFIMASKKMKIVYSGALTIFVAAELIVFQTHAYDNNKLFFMWYLFSCILVADFLINMLDKLKGKKKMALRVCILTLVIVLSSNAAVFTIIREVMSGMNTGIGSSFYCIYDAPSVKACEFIKEETDPSSTFLTYTNHNNAVSSLTGRNIFCGAGTFLASHDVDYTGRKDMMRFMYTDPEYFEINKIGDDYKIDYIYISSTERAYMPNLTENYFKDTYECVYNADGVTIYDVNRPINS